MIFVTNKNSFEETLGDPTLILESLGYSSSSRQISIQKKKLPTGIQLNKG